MVATTLPQVARRSHWSLGFGTVVLLALVLTGWDFYVLLILALVLASVAFSRALRTHGPQRRQAEL